MTTFYILFGRYRFLRMPFGLRISQDIFQRKIDQIYENYRGAVGIADDVQVFGNENRHDRNLHEAVKFTRKANTEPKFDKGTIKTKYCSFVFETCTLQKESSQIQIR